MVGCSQYFKDTKKEAIHNEPMWKSLMSNVVPNTSKILKRKQFTTWMHEDVALECCSQYFKDTKKEAIHNGGRLF